MNNVPASDLEEGGAWDAMVTEHALEAVGDDVATPDILNMIRVFPREVHTQIQHQRNAAEYVAQDERCQRKLSRRCCDWCGRQGLLADPSFPICAACSVPRYCSVGCQRAHWDAGHQSECVVGAVAPGHDLCFGWISRLVL